MESVPKTHEDIEAQIREIQSKKKELPVESNDHGVGLGESGFFDSHIYDGGGGKAKYQGYVTSIAANDDDDEEEEDVGYFQKKTGSEAPVAFLNEVAQGDKDYDPFADKRRPTIADREDEYRSKGRRMIISPERIDPFADDGKAPDNNARGYTQIMKEQMLKREEKELGKKILEKSKDGSLKSTKDEVKSAPKKRGRWDQTVKEEKNPRDSSSSKEDRSRRDKKKHSRHNDSDEEGRDRKRKSDSSDHESRRKRRS